MLPIEAGDMDFADFGTSDLTASDVSKRLSASPDADGSESADSEGVGTSWIGGEIWCARHDSNVRPSAPQADALSI